jgi:ABC-2 type transport system permease protein
MARNRIFNVLKKEWRVLLTDSNSTILITLIPLVIIGQRLLYAWLINTFAAGTIINRPLFQPAMVKFRGPLPALNGLPETEQFRVLLLSQFDFFILLIPTMIAMNSAAFSIVEEKLSHSLEPLLATPVQTWEILLGKALAGAIPACW